MKEKVIKVLIIITLAFTMSSCAALTGLTWREFWIEPWTYRPTDPIDRMEMQIQYNNTMTKLKCDYYYYEAQRYKYGK